MSPIPSSRKDGSQTWNGPKLSTSLSARAKRRTWELSRRSLSTPSKGMKKNSKSKLKQTKSRLSKRQDKSKHFSRNRNSKKRGRRRLSRCRNHFSTQPSSKWMTLTKINQLLLEMVSQGIWPSIALNLTTRWRFKPSQIHKGKSKFIFLMPNKWFSFFN